MARPKKGTPEWDLWVAAIEVAIYPSLVHGRQATGQVSWRRLDALRDALDELGIDWRKAKVASDADRAENARAQRDQRVAAARERSEASDG